MYTHKMASVVLRGLKGL